MFLDALLRGRSLLMTDENLRTAKAMHEDTENYKFISDIIKTGSEELLIYKHLLQYSSSYASILNPLLYFQR